MTYFKLKDKYPNRKVTYTALVKAVSGNEYRTLQSIGDEFGVTRERVRQLLIKHGLSDVPSRQKPDPRKICRHCNNPVEMRYFIRTTSSNKGAWYPASHQECRDKWSVNNWTEVQCTNCQIPIELRKSDARLKRRIKDWLFCSKRCSTTYRVANETDWFGTWAKSSHLNRRNYKKSILPKKEASKAPVQKEREKTKMEMAEEKFGDLKVLIPNLIEEVGVGNTAKALEISRPTFDRWRTRLAIQKASRL